MRALSAAELLEVWERGSSVAPPERALALLQTACPELDAEALTHCSVGRRDGLLMSVRESIFGSRLAALTTCPDCGEQLELGFDVQDLRTAAPVVEPGEPATLAVDGVELRFRLPDSRDQMAAGAQRTPESGRAILLERCVLSARSDRGEMPIDRLPEAVVSRLEEEMSRLDAQADVQIQVNCLSCGTGWTTGFDILGFFWSEIDAWAGQQLVAVHKLASAYGWSEIDILEMSAARRAIYLNMLSE